MGRGATTKPAQQQQAITQQAQKTALANQGQLFNPIVTSEENQLANPGYDAATKNAITQEGMGATRTAYDAMREAAGKRATATHNDAAMTPMLDQAGQAEAGALGQQARQNQILFANNEQSQRAKAQQLLQQMYGAQAGMFAPATSGGVGAAGIQAQGTNPWYDQLINGIAQGAAQGAASGI